MSEEKQEARKGGKAKKIILAVVVTVVAIIGGLVWVGLSTPAEEYVVDMARMQNEHKGKQLDEVTRFDQASANGALLTISHTMSDGWYETVYDMMSEQFAEMLGREPSEEDMLMLLNLGQLRDACRIRLDLVHAEARIISEFHDEQGQPVMSVEANEATCADAGV